MKLTLKDYQADAVRQVLDRLGKARGLLDLDLTSSVALTAPTGAGKTVMAAAVIESLFFGNDDDDVEADPGATVLWFTSDPSLNEQTRHRLRQASERLTSDRLRVIEPTFQDERLRPGSVYFLNSQKLGKNSRLVKGGSAAEDGEMLVAPDLLPRTFWEVLANTIADEHTTLYVFLDEAHVGMNTSKRDLGEKSTIVRQLVNGEAGAPPVPIVLGISATVDRFKAAMESATGRTTLPDVAVDPVRVQESGLLKEKILLSFPVEAGTFDTVLLRHAVTRTKESGELWAAYHDAQGGSGDPVLPLLVVQVPNTPSDEMLLDAVQTIRAQWPELGPDGIAHVFGEHTTLSIGGHEIPYVPPEDVAERTHIRALLAKDAISTGWDCPRAEVLVSFRPARDLTHITQLLGRMVRTPLARSIPGDDRLNSVECMLPLFDQAAAYEVAARIMGAPDAGGGPTVQVASASYGVNAAIPEAVWEAYDRLPTQTVPRIGSRPVSRFTALGAALARDGIVADGHRRAIGELVAFLASQAVRYADRVGAEIDDLLAMSGETIVIGQGLGGQVVTGNEAFELRSDERTIESDYRIARRALSPQLANAYADRLEATYQDDYFEAHLRTSALARIPEVIAALDEEADRLFQRWDNEHRLAIKALADDRRVCYADRGALAGEPQPIEIQRPVVRMEATETTAGKPVPTRDRHLLADEAGRFPIGSLNGWEQAVLESELTRCVAWYRNPSRASFDSLAIAYLDKAGAWRRMCPDFVFFERVRDVVRPSIVDPHGVQFDDALPKLRGLAAYAAAYEGLFHRIEAVAVVAAGTRLLDLTKPAVREAIGRATDAEALYLSAVAEDYA